ncbi:MAG TPA: hybrid sensor histidine kinase/response regulator [Thermoleophilaceae bacterium]
MSISDDELQQLLLATFADQAKEQLQTIGSQLLALEEADAAQRGALFEEIFREAHSLKGAARAVDLVLVERLSHELESLFSMIHKGELEPSSEVFDLAHKALDGLTALVEEGLTGTPADVDLDALCDALESAADGKPAPEPKLPQLPSSPTPQLPPQPAEPARAAAETVRVATAKLDALMAQVGELIAARLNSEHRLADARALLESLAELENGWRKRHPARMLERALSGDERALDDARGLVEVLDRSYEQMRAARAGLADLRRKFEVDAHRMAQVTNDLQDDVRRTRMRPVATVFDSFPRMLRDITRELSKQVKLTIEGGETEVDKQVLEQLGAPLTHMLRNSIDHGVEEPGVRAVAGKPQEGHITLAAFQRAADLVIEISDDGAGIDVDRVKAKAVERGIVDADAAASLSDYDALRLIFRSGFSTKEEVTDLSGRGVGMDVVREHIERLQGVIEVESALGAGTRFTLSVPLSVATTRCLMVEAGGQTFGMPITGVDRIVRLSEDDIGRTQGHDAVRIDERPMALLRLADLLGLPGDAGELVNRPAIIVSSAERRAAVLVDRLVGAQEVATKTLPRPLMRVRLVAGVTILGTGQVVPILNVLDLLRAEARGQRPEASAPPSEARPASQQSILVVDDSVTIRTFEKALLESAGYAVTAAADGLEAWNLIQNEAPDLIVSDVEMPNMTGFELTAKVRADRQLKDMPLVLITTLSSDEDRKRGIDAGADAYVIKGSAEQDQLLDTVRRLI